MKIWIELNVLKEKHVNILKERHPEIEWIIDLDQRFDCDAIFAMPQTLKKELLDQFKHLKWIQLLSAGYDTIDQQYLKERNIVLSNAPDVYSISIAEDVFSKILLFNRHLEGYLQHMKEGLWKNIHVSHEICESTVGIIGAGSIGKEVAKRMKAFGARVLGYKKTYEALENFDQIFTDQEGLNTIYQESDYLIVTLPSSPQTKKMIGKEAFALFKPSLLFINVSRGDIVDQDVLIDALIHDKIRGAGLDVMVPEPLPKDHILWTLDNVFITPHNSIGSPRIQDRLLHVLSMSLDRYVNHIELPNKII
ncbi:MAG: D-2-hydroxyacid dehydrogenase [Acholeplasmataceae bacterium]|nr:D-2-hydroxyacid dehydrogenase [Acholeplasmataceae bacterium]